MSYRFMKAHETEFEVQVMSQALGVSRSGYYSWRKRGESTERERTDRELTQRIATIFETSQQTYGSPRIYVELKAQGVACSREQVARDGAACPLTATVNLVEPL